jgi:hypothetical protein
VLLAVVLVLGACSSDDGGSGSSGGVDEASDSSLATDASLIPPEDATSPTSGPPNTDPLAGASVPDAASCEGRAASPARAARDLDLRISLRETLQTGRVRWALLMTNRGDDVVTLVYPSGQDGDVVLTQDGEEAYRWSEGQAFAQAQRCQLIGPSQEYRLDLRGVPLDVEPGDYVLEASLASDPTPDPAVLDVTVEDPDGN